MQTADSAKRITPATGLGTTPKIPIWEKWNTQRLTLGLVNNPELGKLTTCQASPSALPFIAYQHCPSKQGKERELSKGNL